MLNCNCNWVAGNGGKDHAACCNLSFESSPLKNETILAHRFSEEFFCIVYVSFTDAEIRSLSAV